MEQQCSLSLKYQKKLLKFCERLIKKETQNVVNLLNSSENEFSKFTTRKWFVIDSEPEGSYSHHDQIRFLTKSIELRFFDYSGAYILVIGNIAVTRSIAAAGDNPIHKNEPFTAASQVPFRNCGPLKNCKIEINDVFVDEADFINIAMPMYNLI